MKRKTMILTALAMLAVLVGSCKWNVEGNFSGSEAAKVTKNYENFAPFERIKIDATCAVYYTQGDSTTVKVVATDAETMAKTSVKSHGGTLEIRTKGWSNWKKKKSVAVHVTSPDLIEVGLDGAGSFQAKTPIDTDTLHLHLKGTGNMEFADIICDRVMVHLQGVGNMNFDRLQAQQAQFRLKGVGNIDAHFVNSGAVDCSVQGVGDISLTGEVKSLRKRLQGTGKIDSKNLKIIN